jgi:hypothetical protein
MADELSRKGIAITKAIQIVYLFIECCVVAWGSVTTTVSSSTISAGLAMTLISCGLTWDSAKGTTRIPVAGGLCLQ